VLNIPVETVAYIAMKAKEWDSKVESLGLSDGSNPADDEAGIVLEYDSEDTDAYELASAIERLNDDEKADLIALTWLGRGDFDDYEEALEMALERMNDRTASYLMGDPRLGDHLSEGLSVLGYSPEELEELELNA
jgi:hypothetical protein